MTQQQKDLHSCQKRVSRHWLKAALGGFLVSWSSLVWGLGLGEVTLYSKLHEPLRAEVPLIEVGNLPLANIKASLASFDEFHKAHLQRLHFLSKIDFFVEKNTQGNPVVKISTHPPLKELFLTFILEVKWPGGRLLKEYTLLLDPPQRVKPRSASTRFPQLGFAQNSSRGQPFEGRQWLVSSGDTLWRIAKQMVTGTDMSIQQGMQAILDMNPDSFVNGDMNKILKGQALLIPNLRESSSNQANSRQQDPQRIVLPKEPIEPVSELESSPPKPIPEKDFQVLGPFQKKMSQDPSLTGQNTVQSHKTGFLNDSGSQLSKRLVFIEEALDTLSKTNKELLAQQKALQERNAVLSELLKEREKKINQLKDSMMPHKDSTSLSQKASQPIQDGFPPAQRSTQLALKLPNPSNVNPSKVSNHLMDTPPAVQNKTPNVPMPHQVSPPNHSNLVASVSLFWKFIVVLALGALGLEVLRRYQKVTFKDIAQVLKVNRFKPSFTKENNLKEFGKNESFTPNVQEPQNSESRQNLLETPPKKSLSDTFDIDEAVEAITGSAKTNQEGILAEPQNLEHENLESTHNDFESRLNEASILIAYNRFNQAEDLLLDLKDIEPLHPEILENLSKIYIQQKAYDKLQILQQNLPRSIKQQHFDWVQDNIEALHQFEKNEKKLKESIDKKQTLDSQEKGHQDAQSQDHTDIPIIDLEFSMSKESLTSDLEKEEKTTNQTQGKFDIPFDGKLSLVEEGSKPDMNQTNSIEDLKPETSSSKIALAKFYLNMKDFQSARKILQEIIEKGSEPDKKLAQDLLSKIN